MSTSAPRLETNTAISEAKSQEDDRAVILSQEDIGSHTNRKSRKGAHGHARRSGSSAQRAPLDQRNQELERQVEELRKALKSQESAFREQLSQKDTELAELKTTLCMYDECSEVDIGNMVDAINSKVQNLARNTAVKWVKDAGKGVSGGETCARVKPEEEERLARHIGSKLVTSLKGASNGQNALAPLLLQLAWQGAITSVVKRLLESFSPTLARDAAHQDFENLLKDLSDDVRLRQIQPAYGRWRSLTHQAVGRILRQDHETAIRTYINRALRLCHQATKLILKDHCLDDRSVRYNISDEIRGVVEDAFKLLDAIREKVVTVNYEPHACQSGCTFSPEHMTVGKQDKVYQQDRVICTIGLGMVYSRKKGRENAAESHKMTLRNPQVLTECNLNDMA